MFESPQMVNATNLTTITCFDVIKTFLKVDIWDEYNWKALLLSFPQPLFLFVVLFKTSVFQPIIPNYGCLVPVNILSLGGMRRMNCCTHIRYLPISLLESVAKACVIWHIAFIHFIICVTGCLCEYLLQSKKRTTYIT